MDSPLAKGSSSTSPRSSDEEKASPLPASNGEGGVEEEEEPRDILDMRDHDEMIKGTIKTMEKTHTEPKNIFGLKVTRGPLRVIIQDEVRFGLWALLAALLVAGIIFLIVVATTDDVHFSDSTTNPHGTALIISGIFTIVSCFIAAVQIYMHLTHWSHPASQKLVIRIIFMVPVYSVAAWLALWQLEYSTYIDFVRVCYEAFTLYTFMVLLTQYLGGHAGVVEWMQYKEVSQLPSSIIAMTASGSFPSLCQLSTVSLTLTCACCCGARVRMCDSPFPGSRLSGASPSVHPRPTSCGTLSTAACSTPSARPWPCSSASSASRRAPTETAS